MRLDKGILRIFIYLFLNKIETRKEKASKKTKIMN